MVAYSDGLDDKGPQCLSEKGQVMSHRTGYRNGGTASHLLCRLLKNEQEIGLTDEPVAKLCMMVDRARIRAEGEALTAQSATWREVCWPVDSAV